MDFLRNLFGKKNLEPETSIGYEENSENFENDSNSYDVDLRNKLIKESTAYKKSGDYENAINKINEALEIHKDEKLVYKKSSYLQQSGLSDEAWKVMSSFVDQINTEILNYKLNSVEDYLNFYGLFTDFYLAHTDMVKLLKKQKRFKDIIFYGFLSRFYELVGNVRLGDSIVDIDSYILDHISLGIVDQLKISKFVTNQSEIDNAYVELVKENESSLLDLHRASHIDYHFDFGRLAECVSITKNLMSKPLSVKSLNIKYK